MYTVNSFHIEDKPWLEDKKEVIYLVKDKSGPDGSIVGFMSIMKKRSKNKFEVCTTEVYNKLKLDKKD